MTYSQVRVPRDGGPGVSRHGEQSSPLRHPPAILWVLSHRWESTSPRRAKPCKTARRVVAQASFFCPCGAIHLLAPYEVTETRPLLRPLRGHLPPKGKAKKEQVAKLLQTLLHHTTPPLFWQGNRGRIPSTPGCSGENPPKFFFKLDTAGDGW